MRIVVGKAFNAHRELDGLPEATRRTIVGRVEMRHRGAVALLDMLWACFLVLGIVICIGVVGVWDSGKVGRGMLVGGVTFGAVVAFLPGTWLRERFISRAITRHMRRVSCPACQASLIGSDCSDRRVQCRGCGCIHALAELGLVATDLGPRPIAHSRSACSHCGYELRGLPSVGGRVTCPECGETALQFPQRAPTSE